MADRDCRGYVPGQPRAEDRARWRTGRCNTLYPPHSAPRLEAGAPLADDICKCELKAIDWNDYHVQFTDAEQQRLQKIFPIGVCDWSKPGAGRVPLKGTWQRY